MQSRLNPYIFFRNQAREAITFYKSVFGGELTMQTYSEGKGSDNPKDADKLMHSQLEAPNGITLMASDAPEGVEYNPGTNVSLSLSGEDEAELRGYWDKLSQGANVTMPLNKAPWGDQFGMLTDKYGILWMVNIGAPKTKA